MEMSILDKSSKYIINFSTEVFPQFTHIVAIYYKLYTRVTRVPTSDS